MALVTGTEQGARRGKDAHMSSGRTWIDAALVVLCVGCAAPPARAQSTPAGAARAAHEPLERLDALLEPLLAQFDVPALGGAIVELERGLVAAGVSGVRARGSDVRVELDDRWHLGSCTKAMTATLAARLVAAGKIEFETTVAQAFPELGERIDAKWRPVTLEWLLQNRGGAPGEPPGPVWSELFARDKDPRAARRWFVEQLLAVAPANEPGSKFEYSNQGFVIAGAMLEARTGKDWEALMHRELFEPLGMRSAGFGPPGSAAKLDQPRGHAPEPRAPGPRADNPRAIGPAGTVHASLADWAKFVHEHLRGAAGHKALLSSGLHARLQECPALQAYAMGWGVATRPWAGGDVLTHSGSNTMWYCTVWIAPEKGLAFLATCNDGGESAPKACDEVVKALAKARGLL